MFIENLCLVGTPGSVSEKIGASPILKVRSGDGNIAHGLEGEADRGE